MPHLLSCANTEREMTRLGEKDYGWNQNKQTGMKQSVNAPSTAGDKTAIWISESPEKAGD